MKTTEGVVIDGYDLLAESERLSCPDVVVCGRTLNRATATVSPDGVAHHAFTEDRDAHRSAIFPNTLPADAPVIDLAYPTAGMFVDTGRGVYVDCYQGVAQKIVDEHHPRFQRAIRLLVENGLAFRREINTDDFLAMSVPVEGLHTPQELAAFANRLAAERFPGKGSFRTFFSNSGGESGEAAIKLAQLHTYRKLQRDHGDETIARLMADLGIGVDHRFDDEPNAMPDPLYEDYPFFVFGCDAAFHGRTLGVLNLTASKKAQQIGFSKLRWIRRLTFNGDAAEFTAQLDDRPLPEILDAPGGVSGLLAEGRVPAELVALVAVECYQGEGGYRLAERAWFEGVAAACAERGILFGVDEVQSFGRTGALFAVEHYDVEPDVLWLAKAAVVGMTIARADLADDCHVGWHSNTFGGGKMFDVNLAHATLDVLVNHEDPQFEGRGYLENSRIKGEYMRVRLSDLSARHPDVFPEFSGLGGMWGLSVRHRAEVVELGWKMGVKLLGCGWGGEVARVRILLLADVLTREIDQLVEVLDRVFAEVERRHEGED